MSDVLTYKRGQVWWMEDSISNKHQTIGSVQRGARPVVIYSSDKGNEHNSTLIVFKITSKSIKGNLPVNVKYIDVNETPNIILCNQINTVSKEDLSKYMYTLSEDIMSKVDKAFKLATDNGMHNNIEDIDSKIDEIYKILTDLSVLKSEKLHDTSKDEKVIRDVAAELKKLYSGMHKYYNSTVEELNHDISSLNKYNSKIRMGISTSKTIDSQDKKEITNCSKAKDTNIKPRGYWTPDRKKQFIRDKELLTMDEYMKKYGYTDRKRIMKAYYTYKGQMNK